MSGFLQKKSMYQTCGRTGKDEENPNRRSGQDFSPDISRKN